MKETAHSIMCSPGLVWPSWYSKVMEMPGPRLKCFALLPVQQVVEEYPSRARTNPSVPFFFHQTAGRERQWFRQVLVMKSNYWREWFAWLWMATNDENLLCPPIALPSPVSQLVEEIFLSSKQRSHLRSLPRVLQVLLGPIGLVEWFFDILSTRRQR